MARRAAVQQPQFDSTRRQVFVLGNEAADVDSLVSAYALARLLEAEGVQALALAQIPREEFRLRGDALALFKRAGSELTADGSPAGLVFWDEVDWGSVKGLKERSVVLTDHNQLTAKAAEFFQDHVELILDHHANTQSHPSAEAIIDEALGSACTLVVEQFRAKSTALPPELSTLLAGVIILDTRNFEAKAGKGTARDLAALESLALPLPRGEWYEELMQARKDVSHLSVRELLLLDLKLADAGGRSIAFCSIFGTLRDVCDKAGGPNAFVKEVEAFAASKGLEAAVVFFSKDGQGNKAVAFVPAHESSQGQGICQAISRHLLQAARGTFAEAFASNPLFATQGILEEGFGLALQGDYAPLQAYTMRGAVTRKTLLPFAMSAPEL